MLSNPLQGQMGLYHYYVFSFSKKPEIEAGNWSYITRRILIIPCPLMIRGNLKSISASQPGYAGFTCHISTYYQCPKKDTVQGEPRSILCQDTRTNAKSTRTPLVEALSAQSTVRNWRLVCVYMNKVIRAALKPIRREMKVHIIRA